MLCATNDGFLYFHDAVGHDNLRFTFDTANLFVQKENLALSLRRLADHVDYIPVSDNRGSRVEHLAPGEGAILWEAFFETLDGIAFNGHLGLDIGGDESDLADSDTPYGQAAGAFPPACRTRPCAAVRIDTGSSTNDQRWLCGQHDITSQAPLC